MIIFITLVTFLVTSIARNSKCRAILRASSIRASPFPPHCFKIIHVIKLSGIQDKKYVPFAGGRLIDEEPVVSALQTRHQSLVVR